MPTIPAPDSNAFYITVPEGWSMVDLRRLLDGSLFDVVNATLDDSVVAADIVIRMERRLLALRQEIDDESLMLMALRDNTEGETLQVLTVACPDPDLARRTQDVANQNSQPDDAEPPVQVIQLPSGTDAMIHRAVSDGTGNREIRWTSVQLMMRIPETKLPVILTLLSSDDRDLETLTTEATALAQSISRSIAKGEVTEIAQL